MREREHNRGEREEKREEKEERRGEGGENRRPVCLHRQQHRLDATASNLPLPLLFLLLLSCYLHFHAEHELIHILQQMEGWLLCLDTVTNPFGFGSGLAQPTDMGWVRPIKKHLRFCFFFFFQNFTISQHSFFYPFWLISICIVRRKNTNPVNESRIRNQNKTLDFIKQNNAAYLR